MKEAGKYAGQPYQKPCKLVGNSYFVAARRAAQDTASAGRLLCSALLFVSVVDFALTDRQVTTVTRRKRHELDTMSCKLKHNKSL